MSWRDASPPRTSTSPSPGHPPQPPSGHPPTPGHLHPPGHPSPPPPSLKGNMVNALAVHILLECILVENKNNSLYSFTHEYILHQYCILVCQLDNPSYGHRLENISKYSMKNSISTCHYMKNSNKLSLMSLMYK